MHNAYAALYDAVHTCTLQDVISWCEGQPKETHYAPLSCVNCLFAKYFGSKIGQPVHVEPKTIRFTIWGPDIGEIPLPEWIRYKITEIDQAFENEWLFSNADALNFLKGT